MNIGSRGVHKKRIQLVYQPELTHRILQEDRSDFICARFIEIRLIVYESLKVVFIAFTLYVTTIIILMVLILNVPQGGLPQCLLQILLHRPCRQGFCGNQSFWPVVESTVKEGCCVINYNAVKPFLNIPKTGGQLNTQFFKKVYIVSSITMALFTLPSWLSSVVFSVVSIMIKVLGEYHDDVRITQRTQLRGESAWDCDWTGTKTEQRRPPTSTSRSDFNASHHKAFRMQHPNFLESSQRSQNPDHR